MKSATIGVFFVALTLASGSMLGSRSCTWGPTYWCKGIPESKECGATSHCIDRVWSRQILPEDKDEVCTICKNMVTEARDTLGSNETIVSQSLILTTKGMITIL